jgi:hypothetical protein
MTAMTGTGYEQRTPPEGTQHQARAARSPSRSARRVQIRVIGADPAKITISASSVPSRRSARFGSHSPHISPLRVLLCAEYWLGSMYARQRVAV